MVAAVRAHLSEKGNCHSTTGTLSGAAQVVIVNGPARQALDINCTAGCFGPGWRANATIGRALRLVIRNVCRAIPNFLDRATFSTPARYTFCFGEDEEGSDWLPMSVERGIPAGTSAVTVASMMTMGPATDFVSRTPEGVTASIAKAIRQRGTAGDVWLGDDTNVVVVMGPEHRRYFTEAGWSKADVRAAMWPLLTAPQQPGEGNVKLAKPEGLLLVAAGGPGMAESWMLFPHLAWAITEPVVPDVALQARRLTGDPRDPHRTRPHQRPAVGGERTPRPAAPGPRRRRHRPGVQRPRRERQDPRGRRRRARQVRERRGLVRCASRASRCRPTRSTGSA